MSDKIPLYIDSDCPATKGAHALIVVCWSSRKDERQEMREGKAYMCQHCMRHFESRHIISRHYSKLAAETEGSTA